MNIKNNKTNSSKLLKTDKVELFVSRENEMISLSAYNNLVNENHKTLKNNAVSLHSFFDISWRANVKIPPRQRLYVWTKKEILLFIESLYDDFKEDSSSSWIGTLFITQNSEIYVNDGQQRILSLYLIMLSIYSIVKKPLADYLHDNHGYNLPKTKQTGKGYVSHHSEIINDHMLLLSTDDYKKSLYKKQRDAVIGFIKNKNIITNENKLNENESLKLIKFVEYILINTKFAVISTSDEKYSTKIFVRMNTIQKKITDWVSFRSKVILESDINKFKSIDKEITNYILENESKLNEDDFLRYFGNHFQYKYSKKFQKGYIKRQDSGDMVNLFKLIKNENSEMTWLSIYEEASIAMKRYVEIVKAFEENITPSDQKNKELLNSFALIKSLQVKQLLNFYWTFAFDNSLATLPILKLMRLASKLVIFYKLNDNGNYIDLERNIFNVVLKNKKNDPMALIKLIKRLIKGEDFKGQFAITDSRKQKLDSLFKDLSEKKNKDNNTPAKKINYKEVQLLLIYEKVKESLESYDYVQFSTIDHFAPLKIEKWKDNNPKWWEKEKNSFDDWKNKPGNLWLISPTENNENKSNKWIGNISKLSDFQSVTNTNISSAQKISYFPLNKEAFNKSPWTSESVKKRSMKLKKDFMKVLWNF